MNEVLSGWVRKLVLLVLLLLAVFLGALSINEIRAWDSEEFGNTISVSGEGEVFAVPDLATFSFSVIVEANTASEAQEEAAEIANEALGYLEDNGIAEKDIKTTNYNVYPRYDYNEIRCITFPCPQGERVLQGFEINQTFTVKVRDTEKAGEILSGVGATGVQNISGLSFTIDDMDALRAEAREKAIADAKEKAQILAKQLGVDLDDVVAFYENGGGDYYPRYDVALESKGLGGDATTANIAPQLPTGENKIVSQVNITYEID